MGVLGVKDIMQKYGLTRYTVTKLLHMQGCPLVARKKGESYKVHAEAFDKWLANQIYRRK